MSQTFKNFTDLDVAMHNAKVEAGKGGKLVLQDPEAVEREADLHDQIFDECRSRGFIALHSAMSERTTRNKGEWDFTVIGSVMIPFGTEYNQKIREPRIWFIECKAKNGKLTAEQTAMIVHAQSHGHTVHIVRSLSAFINIIDNPSGAV